MTVLTSGRNFLLFIGACYAAIILALLNSTLQRELFYLNSLKFPWLVDTGRPETCGFSTDRVTSFFLPGDVHAWHVKPLQHIRLPGIDDTSKPKLIIYFHGTAGTLAVPHRLTTYRILSSLPDTHVLTIDYRGYGLSPGNPSEPGLIEDGLAAVAWAREQGFAPDQITLFGQSLGSAVAIAVAHRLAIENPDKVEVHQIVSVAGFFTAAEVVKTYRVAGVIPVLSPFRTYPILQNWLIGRLQHKWDSATRVRQLVKETNIKLTFVHAKTDNEILREHSERLFTAAVEATYLDKTENQEDLPRGIAHMTHSGVSLKDLPDGGRLCQLSGQRQIAYLEMYWGAHNLVQWNDELIKRL